MCNKKTRSAEKAGPGSWFLALAVFIKRPQAEFKLAPQEETYPASRITSTLPRSGARQQADEAYRDG
jgi:hypothetical protein